MDKAYRGEGEPVRTLQEDFNASQSDNGPKLGNYEQKGYDRDALAEASEALENMTGSSPEDALEEDDPIADGGMHEYEDWPPTLSDEEVEHRIDKLLEETDGCLPGEKGYGARELQREGRAYSGPGSETFEV